MFTTLHELAKKATLMITIAAEGDGQMRVNVTPMPFDTKAKSNLPQPLSLLAPPTEFDADFIAALSTWQAPKRTLVQQAQDATSGGAPAAATPALPAPKADSKNDKAARKTRGGKSTDEDKKVDQVPDAGAAAGEAAAASDQAMADSTAAGAGEDAAPDQGVQQGGAEVAGDAGAAAAPAPAASVPAVADVHTLDLF